MPATPDVPPDPRGGASGDARPGPPAPPAHPEAAGGAAISASRPDWSRERPRGWWDPPRRLLRAVRRAAAARGALARRWWRLQHRFWSVVTQAEIHPGTEIGGGLLIPHPNGIVIHPGAVIGPNCLIFQQVTLGEGPRPGLPRIGGHVDIGAGARILGGVTVGDHARIGANAVVIDDVPPGATAVGVPARIVAAAGGASPAPSPSG